jgi:hypothetical protein
MNVNYTEVIKNVKGTFVPKPLSGTLSGHSAGEPFDKHVYSEIKKQLPNNTFRQYEYLNDLYSKNAEIIGLEARQALFNSPSVLFLLSRGKEATKKWSLENPFDEKQDDTADILVVKAQLCAIMLDNKEFDNLSINYFEIDWLLEDDKLVCKDAHFVSLFMSIPENLYINWAAAMQIQFHVCNLDQDFKGTIEAWAKTYLKHFVAQVYRRSEYMIEKYAKPFEKYLL